MLLVILVLTFLAYLPSLKNNFIDLDDISYVTSNPLIMDLSLINIKKIFSSFVVGNYHPLTILVFAVEFHFFQLNPFYFHLTNLLLHLLNTILVFIFIYQLCKKELTALIVSAFFGLHPMHVESVAWVTELKDVLYFCFYMIGLIIYLKSQKLERFKLRYYLGTLLLYITSLLSKPTAVSFPLVLLCIDYFNGRKISKKMFLEKIPFFAFSIIFGMIAFYAGKSSFMPFETITPERITFSFGARVILCAYALWDYLIKAFLPIQLSIFYPYPSARKVFEVPLIFYCYFIALLGTAWLIYKYFIKEKVIVFGLGLFLTTIFFNLPFFNVGYSLSADRFTYLPYVGIFFIVGYYLEKFYVPHYARRGLSKYWREIVFIGMIFIFSFLTFQRCIVWENAKTLWYDVAKKFPKHPLGYDNLANFYYNQGDNSTTLKLCDIVLSLNSKYYTAFCRKADVYLRTNKLTNALEEYTRAINIFPYYYQALMNRGSVFYLLGKPALAVKDYTKALIICPNNVALLSNRATAYFDENHMTEALADFNLVIKLSPENKYAKDRIIEIEKKITSSTSSGI